MAIIKPIKFLGFDPYWWIVKEVREDRLENSTIAILCLYADSYTHETKPNEYIPGIFPSVKVNGIGLTNDQIVAEFLNQHSSDSNWIGAVNTNSGYFNENVQSNVYVKISNDKKTNVIRFAEIVDFRFYCKNKIIVVNANIFFDTIIDNVINTDESKFLVDSSKTRTITWIVDDYYTIPNTGIGEATYFINDASSAKSMFDVLRDGILYGDTMGYIDSKL